ncbi:MAG: preprotein translocase subunit YajC [Eubacteriales bacterium]
MFYLLLAEGTTSGEPADGCGSAQTWIIYGILALLIIGFFVWTMVSNKKRQKQEQEKLAGIRVGDKVKTIGGVCGVIVAIDDAENTFTMETGSGDNVSYIKFDKGAIYQTAPANGGTPAANPEADKNAQAPAEPFEENAPAEAAEPAEEEKKEDKE